MFWAATAKNKSLLPIPIKMKLPQFDGVGAVHLKDKIDCGLEIICVQRQRQASSQTKYTRYFPKAEETYILTKLILNVSTNWQVGTGKYF